MPQAPMLPQELTIYSVGEWLPRCRAWLEADDAARPLAVGAQAVAEVDAAGVQLLIALANSLARRGSHLQLLQPSASLAAACERLGASALLGGGPAPGGGT